MNHLEADRVLKAVVDGVVDYRVIADRSGLETAVLIDYAEVLDRAIQLMRGFFKYAHENMKPAGLPPPPGPGKGPGVWLLCPADGILQCFARRPHCQGGDLRARSDHDFRQELR